MRRSTTRQAVAGCLVMVVAAMLFAIGVPRQATAAGGDWLAFVRDPSGGSAFESGDEEIYAIRTDGTGAVRLTTNSCIDITPAASPNGRWLAWVQKCGGAVDIMMAPVTYDATGQLRIGAVTNVTASLGPGSDRWPQFSPDNQQLAFMRISSGNFDIWRAKFDGSMGTTPAITGAVRVVRLGGSQVEDCCVTWSPDGAHLVWASNVNRYQQSFNLYRIASTATDVWDATRNVDGSADGTLDVTIAEQLTFGREYEGTPQYDSRGVLFRCNCPNGDVYRLDVATKTRTRLTTHLGLDRTPEGFPGGITYSRFDNVGGDEIYVAGPNGENPTNVTRHPWSDRDPTFIPAQP